MTTALGALRVGHALDAHRFVEGRPLMLGGVQVSHPRGLLGHSDGDCISHALANALLGAAGLGDIGEHFPSAEQRWKDLGGLVMLDEVRQRLGQAEATVLSAHVVVVAQEPRLAAHLATMAERMSESLGLNAHRLAVSVTSTDGLGFCGRGEGISASAVALVEVDSP